MQTDDKPFTKSSSRAGAVGSSAAPHNELCEPMPVKQSELYPMKWIDGIDMESPAWGCWKVCAHLTPLWTSIGRPNCSMIAGKVRLYCINRKRRTTIRHLGYKIHPSIHACCRTCLAYASNQVWELSIKYFLKVKRCVTLARVDGHLQQKKSVKCDFKHTECEYLR